MGNGIFRTTKRIKGQSYMVMEGRISIVQGDRLPNQAYRHVVAADLVGNDAKKMKAIDVILIDREDFPVAAFSFGKSASSMMPQRRFQQLSGVMRQADGYGGRRRRNGD